MENATKALLIAGGVLIAMVIILIGIYLYSIYSEQSTQYSQIISATELEKFNSKFNVYLGRNNITAQEIVSVVNLAEEYNNQIEVYLGKTRLSFIEISQEEFIKTYLNTVFSCENNSLNPVYNQDGKIIKLTFKKS